MLNLAQRLLGLLGLAETKELRVKTLGTSLTPEIVRIFGGKWPENWVMENDEPNSCRIAAPEFTASFFRDVRNNHIHSVIERWGCADAGLESIYPHTIAHMFRDLSWQSAPSVDRVDVSVRARAEMENFCNVIAAIAKSGASHRDLCHFQDGYSCAYNDYYSGKWD